LELKTLIIGMFISMAAFSVKAGIGWAYMLRTGFPRAKLRASLAVAAVYAALFAGVYFIAGRVNLIASYETLLPLLRGGMTIHWTAAVFTFAWGLALLGMCLANGLHHGVCENGGRWRARYAWLALVVPCPVCMSAVLMSAACLALYFPGDAAASVAVLYAAFMILAAASGTASFVLKNTEADPERALGEMMMLVSAYFIVSALVAPQFAEAGRIYRIAAYSREQGAEGRVAAACVTLALFALGYGYGKLKSKISEMRGVSAQTRDYGGETR
jgi:predicted transporter